jgi:hypothetical protein
MKYGGMESRGSVAVLLAYVKILLYFAAEAAQGAASGS